MKDFKDKKCVVIISLHPCILFLEFRDLNGVVVRSLD